MSEKPSFFAELKRRNVYKVAVAYVVICWLLIQAASILFPTFDAPQWVMKAFVAFLVLGFPAALVFAWAFEITPEGIKRESEVASGESITHHTGRKIVGFTVAFAVIAAGLMIFQFFRSHFAEKSTLAEAAPLSEKSIAVLPFANLSEEKANAYFTEGIQDEIITRLAKVADLKVISRTSTQRFQSAPEDLRQIARQLGVTNILEGSVQKANDQVRVNVQLINAMTQTHLWADIYDRKLTDIFAVESEIAKAITETLRARLTGAEEQAIAAKPTESTEAHDLYLKGRFFMAKRARADLERAIDYFNQAVSKDPGYARAYAGLADTYSILPDYSRELVADVLPKARAAAEKAIALDPNLAEAHSALGLVLQSADLNLTGAKREFERAIELNPNYAEAHYFLGCTVLPAIGQVDKGILEVQRALELDPFSLIINTNLGYCYFLARRYPDAVAQLRKATELDPTFPYALVLLGSALYQNGDTAGAIAEFEKTRQVEKDDIGGPHMGLAWLAHIHGMTGDRDKARHYFNELQEIDRRGGKVFAYGYALIHLSLGETNEAIDWLERSYQLRETGIIQNIRVDPKLDSLRSDSRFQKLADQIVPLNTH